MVILSPGSSVATAAAVAVAAEDHEMSTWILAIALACWIWYSFILLVQSIGIFQLYVNYHPYAKFHTDGYIGTNTTHQLLSQQYLRP
jgi:hypothetical protein